MIFITQQHVIVMNMRWWDRWDKKNSHDQQPNRNEEEEEEEEEHYPPVNGCQMYDVGWAKISVNQLYPTLYCLLSGNDLWCIVCKLKTTAEDLGYYIGRCCI